MNILLTSFLNSAIVDFEQSDIDLQRAKNEVQKFINQFGSEFKVSNAEICNQGYSPLIRKKCVLVKFYPSIRLINGFEFNEFGNSFYTHRQTSLMEVERYCLSYLNTNYPRLAPFTINRIETKSGENAKSANQYLDSNEMLITFSPLINTKWD